MTSIFLKGVVEHVHGEATAVDPINVQLDPRNTHKQQKPGIAPDNLDDYANKVKNSANRGQVVLQKDLKSMALASTDYDANLQTTLSGHNHLPRPK